VLGGGQSLHTNSRDEALGLPTEESVRIALRTQQIIAYESGVTNTVDPMGGSEVLEGLTDQMEQEVYRYLETIDTMGGTLHAVETGFIQNEIQTAAYAYQQDVESGKRITVGVNRFRRDDEHPIPALHIDPALEQAQIERLRQVRASRDQSVVGQKLTTIKETAHGAGNLVPPILEAAAAYATVGEISDALRAVFGEYREP
jgi:methylmalonyl-CoA mutase, N-terminal domain